MVKTVKAKGNSKKQAVKRSGSTPKVARPLGKGAAKYEQPGAPWWKRVPAPPPKSI